jgi:hypothetical protein
MHALGIGCTNPIHTVEEFLQEQTKPEAKSIAQRQTQAKQIGGTNPGLNYQTLVQRARLEPLLGHEMAIQFRTSPTSCSALR